MKKNKLNQSGNIAIIILLVILVIAGALGWWYFKDRFSDLTSSQPTQVESPQEPTQITSDGMVTIDKNGFTPATITIKKGSQLIWKNADTASHWVASDPHPTHTNLPGLDSLSAIKTGESYAFIFEKVGTFTYHDHLNPFKLKGTIIVTD